MDCLREKRDAVWLHSAINCFRIWFHMSRPAASARDSITATFIRRCLPLYITIMWHLLRGTKIAACVCMLEENRLQVLHVWTLFTACSVKTYVFANCTTFGMSIYICIRTCINCLLFPSEHTVVLGACSQMVSNQWPSLTVHSTATSP